MYGEIYDYRNNQVIATESRFDMVRKAHTLMLQGVEYGDGFAVKCTNGVATQKSVEAELYACQQDVNDQLMRDGLRLFAACLN